MGGRTEFYYCLQTYTIHFKCCVSLAVMGEVFKSLTSVKVPTQHCKISYNSCIKEPYCSVSTKVILQQFYTLKVHLNLLGRTFAYVKIVT